MRWRSCSTFSDFGGMNLLRNICSVNLQLQLGQTCLSIRVVERSFVPILERVSKFREDCCGRLGCKNRGWGFAESDGRHTSGSGAKEFD